MLYAFQNGKPCKIRIQRALKEVDYGVCNRPKGLNKIKSKVMFNLTKRQLICFSAAVAIGLPLFFLTKDSADDNGGLCMVLAMLPMFLLAMYEKNGQPLEVIIRQLWK